MAAPVNYDLVRQTVGSAPGTGNIPLSGAQTGWLTFALAGATNGQVVRYAINDNGASEIGTATYNSAGPSLSGRTVTQSTNGGATINASAGAIILSCVAAEDLAVGGTTYGTMAGQNASAVAITGGSIGGTLSGSPVYTGQPTWKADNPNVIPYQLLVTGATNVNQELLIGYDTSSNYGSIQAYLNGVGPQPLLLNVAGGNVGVGGVGVLPDSPFTINMNTAASPGSLFAGTVFHIIGANSSLSRIVIDTFADPGVVNFRRAEGTASSPSAVGAGQIIGAIGAGGYTNAGAWATGGGSGIVFSSLNSWTSGDNSGYTSFKTTPSGTTTLTEMVRIWASGSTQVGGSFSTDPGYTSLFTNSNVSGSFPSTGYNFFNGTVVNYSVSSIGGSAFGDGVNLTVNSSSASAAGGGGLFGFGSIVTVQTQSSSVNSSSYTGLFGSGIAATATSTIGAGIWASNSNVLVESGATGWHYAVGTEIDVQLQAAVVSKWGNVVFLGPLDAFAGTTNDAGYILLSDSSLSPGFTYGYQIDTQVTGFSPISSTGTAFGTRGSMSIGTALDLSSATCSVAEIKTAHMTLDGSGNLSVTGPAYSFGVTSSALTEMSVIGPSTGTGLVGSFVSVRNGASNIVLFGNYSGVWAHDHHGGTTYDPMGLIYSAGAGNIGSTIQPGQWLYISGQVYPGVSAFNSASTSPDFPQGVAFGWNQSNAVGETNLVANLGSGAGPWDFILQDWNGTTLSNLAYFNQGGGLYIPSTLSQIAVGGNTFPQGSNTFGQIGGSTPTQSASGNSDTFFAIGLGSSDSTRRLVPYNATTGILLGNAEQCTLFVGNSSAGTGDPTPQGCTTSTNVSAGKANFASGASTYGQTGGMWINAYGGWAGSSITFTQSVTLSTATKNITPSAAPTNHAYVVGMPVTGTGIPANTCIVSISGSVLTLSSTPTVNAAETLTFHAGTPITTPATASPGNPNAVATGYNPYAGTPGDTFAINGQIAIYDNGIGAAEILEMIVSQFTPGGSTPNFQQRVLIGNVSGGLINLFGSTGFHMVGFTSSFTAGGGLAFYAAGVTTFDFGGTSTGFILDSSLSVHNVSEPMLKDDIRHLPSSVNALMAIDPVTYRYNEKWRGEDDRVGFLVRDHEEFGGVVEGIGDDLLRSIVTVERTDGTGLKQAYMFPVLWKATQELWTEVNDLTARMNRLEGRVERLESLVVIH